MLNIAKTTATLAFTGAATAESMLADKRNKSFIIAIAQLKGFEPAYARVQLNADGAVFSLESALFHRAPKTN